MNFYEVLLPGYHSPLTKAQIGELFQAGRLKRNDPCKPVVQKEWQTIDELFPLLKYRSVGPAPYTLEETTLSPDSRRLLVIFGFLIAGCAAIAFCWYYFAADHTEVISRSARTTSNWPQTISVTNSQPQVSRQAPVTTGSAPYNVTDVQPATTPQDAPAYVPRNTAAIQEAQLAEQRRQAEERQRAQIERERLAGERTRQEEKAAGRDHHVALDDWQTIDVGGESVMLKIHDNDTTSFDVWINYGVRREVKKEKGITHSRTDETLIYSNGRAALYYVWEISGRINHCLLRVREE